MGKVKKSTSIKIQIAALEKKIKYLKKKHKEVKNKETNPHYRRKWMQAEYGCPRLGSSGKRY